VHSLLDLDLTRASVFLDFDGTITQADTGVHLLEQLASPEWRELSAAYARGDIGSRECLIAEWALLPRDEAQVRAVAAEVPLDPGFEPLVAALGDAGAEVTVVSDGFGFNARQVCDDLGLPVLTNTVDFATGELEFPYEDRCCPCSTCGMCKQAPVKEASRRRRLTVLVGDGTSDRKAALLTDVVFAKGALAQWCSDNAVPHVRFATLDQVRAVLFDPSPPGRVAS